MDVEWMDLISKRLITIDIGNYNTKIIQGKRMRGRIIVQKAVVFKTPESAIEDGRITNINALAMQIKQHLQDKKIREKNTIITITGTSIITRDVYFPKVSNKELKNMIRLDAQQHFPVELAGYVTDYKVLEEIQGENGKQLRVMLVAVPKSMIEGYMQLLEVCGLHAYGLDFVGNSIAKFINHSVSKSISITSKHQQNGTNDTVAVLDIGHKTTTVTIISNGCIKFNRILLLGSSNFINMISNNLNISNDVAEQKMIKNGAVILYGKEMEQEDRLMSEGIRSILIGFIDDVMKFFDFYHSRNKANQINKVYLLGGGSLVDGMEGYLEDGFNIKTQKLIVHSNIKVTKKHKQEFDKIQVHVANCLGAILTK